jgi:hypothetical protein
LPPESASVEEVSLEVGVGVQTLQRWLSDALSRPARERAWTAPARLEAVIATAAMDEAARSAWCREHGVYPQQLQQWRESATQALAAPEEARASPQQTRQDRRRIKALEREVLRKDKALAETAALLVLSRKLEAVFKNDKGEADCSASKTALSWPRTSTPRGATGRAWSAPARRLASPCARCSAGSETAVWWLAIAAPAPYARCRRTR